MVVIKKDIVYDEQTQLKTDIYFPNETSSQTKILIFWHGGGWVKGDKDSVKKQGVQFANAGFMTLIPEYRLADQAKFPAAHQDAVNFVKWLLASRYTDPDDQKNIVQIGASVGGTMALYIAGQFGFPTVTWSAPTDFSNWLEHHQDTKADLAGSKAEFYKYFSLAYAPKPADWVKLDAASYPIDQLGPLFMINSAQELNSLSSLLHYIDFLGKNNKQVQLLVLPGQRHAMAYADEYLDESIDFLHQIIRQQTKG
ncbi:MAG: alpha/beta hydrolase [Lactobacillus sp.]|jgi:acetyl esterase/lipase|nr:alpha/beta hydrolase [Lactobacillus sp.]MCH3905494.1 alpha/beta hydrolase [Lactobacillus sp.]MCH3990939.1 alpha/beta hydrolase [Lactobacillus sp.]MCH4068345.1 alpha/beta hydrolase [Lactobacillus sp.]MCI1304358.1 alpha/beta hydrolase [Lactobacillus sp.]